MKKKVNSAESGKAVRRKGSKEVNPFEAEDYAKFRHSSTATVSKSRANPFKSANSSLTEDTVSFEFSEDEVSPEEAFSEAPISQDSEEVIKPSRKCKTRTEAVKVEESAASPVIETVDYESSVGAEASEAADESEEAPAKDSPKRTKSKPTPAQSEETAKKIWLIESALAVLASFLALIVASIY